MRPDRQTGKIKRTRKNNTRKKSPIRTISPNNNFETKIIKELLTMIINIKMFHWNTHNFASHKASDELYSSLNKKMDEFVEVLLGKPENTKDRNKRSKLLHIKHLTLHNFRDINLFKREIEKYKQFFINLSDHKMFKTDRNSDLLNIRDEILADLNQFLYLLTLL